MGDKIKICSLNVRGMGDYKKRKSIFNFLKAQNADVYFLQETHVSCEETAQLWRHEWNTPMFHSWGTTQSAGVSIISKNQVSIIDEIKDNEGRLLILNCEIKGTRFLLINLYGYNRDNPEFFLSVIEKLELIKDLGFMVMGGDYNLVLEPKLDRHKSLVNYDKSVTVLKEYTERAQLMDIWRQRNPSTRRYTWHRNKRLSASRIDMFLITQNVVDYVESCDIIPAVNTDHSLIMLEMRLGEVVRGKGFWKFNNKLLDNSVFREEIHNVIQETVSDHPLCNPVELCTAIKINMTNHSKNFSINQAKDFRAEIKNLQSAKNQLIVELHKDGSEKEAILNCIDRVNHELKLHDDHIMESSAFRARCNWIRQGEVSNKYFFSLEKRNYMNKNMKCIALESGEISYDQDIILEEQTKFYKVLYMADPTKRFRIQRNAEDPLLSTELKNKCEAELTVHELYDAVMTMKRNKVGGPDGFTAKFYQIFFHQLKNYLFAMYQYAFQQGLLPSSVRKGLISLLPKKHGTSRT